MKEEIIEVGKEVQIGDYILESGDKIKVLNERGPRKVRKTYKANYFLRKFERASKRVIDAYEEYTGNSFNKRDIDIVEYIKMDDPLEGFEQYFNVIFNEGLTISYINTPGQSKIEVFKNSNSEPDYEYKY